MTKTLIEIAAWSVAAPAAISFAIVSIGGRLGSRGGGEIDRASALNRILAAAAFAAAFFVSFEIQRIWFQFTTSVYWRWIAYLVLAGAFAGGLLLAEKLSAVERWIALLLLAALVAWRSTPTWPALALPEALGPLGESLKKLDGSSADKKGHQVGFYLLIALGYLSHVALVDRAAKRAPSSLFAAALSATSCAMAVLVAALFSIQFAQVFLAAAGAAAGVAVGCRLHAGRAPQVRGMTAAWCAATVAMAFASYLNLNSRPVAMLLMPFAPLALFVPIGQMKGWKAAAIRMGLVALVLAACAALVVWAEKKRSLG